MTLKKLGFYGQATKVLGKDISKMIAEVAAHAQRTKDLNKSVSQMQKSLGVATKKPKTFTKGFVVGGGAGTVAAGGIHALFGDKKRKSPYYP